MGKVYKSAFVIPASAEMHLTDNGWEFASAYRLSKALIDALAEELALRRSEFDEHAEVFEGEGIKLIVLLDDAGAIEQIFAQLHGRSPGELRSVIGKFGDADIKLFVPSEELA